MREAEVSVEDDLIVLEWNDTGELAGYGEQHDQQKAFSIGWSLPDGFQTKLFFLVELDLCSDLVIFLKIEAIIKLFVLMDPSKDFQALVIATSICKIPRRLGRPDRAYQHQGWWQELQSQQ